MQSYPNNPKMNNFSIIAPSICSEAICIDSENHLWSKIRKDHKSDFPQLFDRSTFNKRCRKLYFFIYDLTRFISNELKKIEDIFCWIPYQFQNVK